MAPKSVQELNMSVQDLPEKYFYKGSDGGVRDGSLLFIEFPVIDIGLLTSLSPSKEEFKKFRSALSFWGCFQAVNHGIEAAFLDKVREVTKQFFALPSERKQKYTRDDGSVEGYGSDMIV